MDRLYHGCMLKNADRTNKIIAAGENGILPTHKYFWKDPSDVKNKVKTRSQTENEPTVDFKTFMITFLKENRSINGYLA